MGEGYRARDEPRWAGQSGELIFTARNWPATRTAVAARVDAKRDPPLGTMTRLFDLRPDNDWGSCDVTPNGQRLLFTRPLGGGSESARHLVLVHNWQSQFEDNRQVDTPTAHTALVPFRRDFALRSPARGTVSRR